VKVWKDAAFALAALIAVASALAPSANALTPEELYELVSPSVVIVWGSTPEGDDSLGSGVVVAPRMVATNCHVLTGQKDVEVYADENGLRATLRAVDWRRDVCILHVAGLSAPPVRVSSAESLRAGQKVYAIGAPEGLHLTLSDGLVSGFRDFEYGVVIQTSAPISPGSSGGGLFDERGTLVGITTSVLEEGQNLNFAHPADWVTELLERDRSEARRPRQ
jgi:S1-C subfamily serine protease